MNIRNLTLIAIMAIVVLTAGCGGKDKATQKPLSAQELALLKEYRALDKKFEALPKSTIAALKAKDLVGKKVWTNLKDEDGTDVLNVLIVNGARLASEGEADLVITKVYYGAGAEKAIVIWDKKNKIPFTCELTQMGFSNVALWADGIAKVLGCERKVQELAEAKKTATR